MRVPSPRTLTGEILRTEGLRVHRAMKEAPMGSVERAWHRRVLIGILQEAMRRKEQWGAFVMDTDDGDTIEFVVKA